MYVIIKPSTRNLDSFIFQYFRIQTMDGKCSQCEVDAYKQRHKCDQDPLFFLPSIPAPVKISLVTEGELHARGDTKRVCLYFPLPIEDVEAETESTNLATEKDLSDSQLLAEECDVNVNDLSRSKNDIDELEKFTQLFNQCKRKSDETQNENLLEYEKFAKLSKKTQDPQCQYEDTPLQSFQLEEYLARVLQTEFKNIAQAITEKKDLNTNPIPVDQEILYPSILDLLNENVSWDKFSHSLATLITGTASNQNSMSSRVSEIEGEENASEVMEDAYISDFSNFNEESYVAESIDTMDSSFDYDVEQCSEDEIKIKEEKIHTDHTSDFTFDESSSDCGMEMDRSYGKDEMKEYVFDDIKETNYKEEMPVEWIKEEGEVSMNIDEILKRNQFEKTKEDEKGNVEDILKRYNLILEPVHEDPEARIMNEKIEVKTEMDNFGAKNVLNEEKIKIEPDLSANENSPAVGFNVKKKEKKKSNGTKEKEFFPCGECPKTCLSNYSLMTHMKSHSGKHISTKRGDESYIPGQKSSNGIATSVSRQTE